jgi:hypothetical protein
VHAACRRWLIFVEGVGFCQSKNTDEGCSAPSAAGQDPYLTAWWGENLQGVSSYPVDIMPATGATKDGDDSPSPIPPPA